MEKILTCNSFEEEKIKGVLAVEMPYEKWLLKPTKVSVREESRKFRERCGKSKVIKLRASLLLFFKLWVSRRDKWSFLANLKRFIKKDGKEISYHSGPLVSEGRVH